MEKKYVLLTDDTIKVDDITLYRIKALRYFGDVHKGDLGGYIEKEENLSHDKDPRYKYKTTRVNVFVGAFSTGTVVYYAPENYWYKPVAHTLDKVIFKNKQERTF